jgi:hypothetical protein
MHLLLGFAEPRDVKNGRSRGGRRRGAFRNGYRGRGLDGRWWRNDLHRLLDDGRSGFTLGHPSNGLRRFHGHFHRWRRRFRFRQGRFHHLDFRVHLTNRRPDDRLLHPRFLDRRFLMRRFLDGRFGMHRFFD